MQPLSALSVKHAEADTPVRAAMPTPTTSSTPAAQLVFAKLPPAEAITQVSGQPDRGTVLLFDLAAVRLAWIRNNTIARVCRQTRMLGPPHHGQYRPNYRI